MKTFTRLVISFFFFMFTTGMIFAQCTPGDENTCPDPENNGEVCPAVLPNGIIGQPYSQEFTIIIPPEYVYMGNTIPIDHIKIMDVGNLPPDITWETNAEDSIFNPDTYYCVLLSGTCAETGEFPLKIVVNAYVDFSGTIIEISDITDSTSISMKVTWDPNGIQTYRKNQLNIKLWPNPFHDEITFTLPDINDRVTVELYSIIGNSLLTKKFEARPTNSKYQIRVPSLPNGTYMLRVTSGKRSVSRLIRKIY